MRKLRTVVVDDEPLARRLMRSMLSELDNVELVAECRNGREAIAAVQGLAPDLLLLDIKMPGMTGFDVVRELQAVRPNSVRFVRLLNPSTLVREVHS